MTSLSTDTLQKLFEKSPHSALKIQGVAPCATVFYDWEPKDPSAEYVLCYGCGKLPPEKDHRRTWFVFEPDMQRLAAFLSTPDGERLLDHPQVELFDAPEEEVLIALAWRVSGASATLAMGTPDGFEAFAQQWEGIHMQCAMLFCDYADFGMRVHRNFLTTLRQKRFCQLSSFRNAFAGRPAIICGAGASLDRWKKALQEAQNKAIIIGVGSAIRVLQQWNIAMDFACVLDPDPPLERYEGVGRCEAPVVFLGRAHPTVLSFFSGPLVYAGTNGGHPLEEWMASYVGLTSTLQGGWNAGTFGVELADFLGCTPLHSVGIDNTVADYASAVRGAKRRAYGETQLSAKWLAEYNCIPFDEGAKLQPIDKKLAIPPPFFCDGEAVLRELEKRLQMARRSLEALPSLVDEVELESNPLCAQLLDFLWSIWKYRFSDDNDSMQKYAFFYRVVKELEAICARQRR